MREKSEWLQALRGVAALMVLFFHLGPHWSTVPQLAVLTPAMHWGFAGVDVFFVLSGFVVHRSTQQLAFGQSLRKYALRRAARIYLTYWPALLAVVLLNVFVLAKPVPAPDVIWRSVLLLEPSMFKNWLPVAWSLTYELYFYVLLGAIMLFPPARQGRLILLLIAAVVAWNSVWLIGNRPLVFADGIPMRFMLSGYILEFMAGALLSQLMLNAQHHGQPLMSADNGMNWFIVGAGSALLGLAVGSTSPYFDRIEIIRAASFGLVGLGGLLMALAAESMTKRAPAWLARVGDYSFGLYLIHAPLLDVAGTLRTRVFLVHDALAVLVSLLTPVVVVLISAVWFALLEAPAIRLTRRLH